LITNFLRLDRLNLAFLLAYIGIFCLSIAVVSLAVRVRALEKSKSILQLQQLPQQLPKSLPQSKSIYQHSEREPGGQLTTLNQTVQSSDYQSVCIIHGAAVPVEAGDLSRQNPVPLRSLDAEASVVGDGTNLTCIDSVRSSFVKK
jgi:hypothetical protein